MTAWTTPATYTTSEVVTAAKLNTHIRDNLNHLAEQISRSAWTSFTPTLSNLTVGSGGTTEGYYALAGKTTIFRVSVTLGSSGFSVGAVGVDLPFTSVSYSGIHNIGWINYYDNGTAYYTGPLLRVSTSAATLYVSTVSGSYISMTALSSSVPFTWAATDQILFWGMYERA